MSDCTICADNPVFGTPSPARWLGPDGGEYCSMHFIQTFGHCETLVKLAEFEAPKATLPPAEKKPKKAKAPKEVKS